MLGYSAASRLYQQLQWILCLVPSFRSVWPLHSWTVNCNWDCTFTNELLWLLTVPSLSCISWPLCAFKTSTTWMTLTHCQVQLQHEVQSWLSLKHSFFMLSENTSQKISPQWCWSLFFCFVFLFFVLFCFFGFSRQGFSVALAVLELTLAGLELRNLPASASQVLGLKACTTTAQLLSRF